MKIALIAALAALGLGAAAFAGIGRPDSAHGTAAPAGTPAAPTQEITVTATGTVKQVPDEAQLVFSVVSRADNAKDALAENSTDTRKVIDALKHAGVAGKDIQTQDVSLQPHYTENSSVIDGYIANNSVSVTSPIGKAGALVDTGVAAGANEVSGPSLSISDQDALYRAALKDAVAAARLKAQAIADAAGVGVGHVTNVVEGDTNSGEPMVYAAAMKDAAAAPIEPGTQEIQASVTVTFAIS
jgi:uncharacterized protein